MTLCFESFTGKCRLVSSLIRKTEMIKSIMLNFFFFFFLERFYSQSSFIKYEFNLVNLIYTSNFLKWPS